jgi:hypothetical protein
MQCDPKVKGLMMAGGKKGKGGKKGGKKMGY